MVKSWLLCFLSRSLRCRYVISRMWTLWVKVKGILSLRLYKILKFPTKCTKCSRLTKLIHVLKYGNFSWLVKVNSREIFHSHSKLIPTKHKKFSNFSTGESFLSRTFHFLKYLTSQWSFSVLVISSSCKINRNNGSRFSLNFASRKCKFSLSTFTEFATKNKGKQTIRRNLCIYEKKLTKQRPPLPDVVIRRTEASLVRRRDQTNRGLPCPTSWLDQQGLPCPTSWLDVHMPLLSDVVIRPTEASLVRRRD